MIGKFATIEEVQELSGFSLQELQSGSAGDEARFVQREGKWYCAYRIRMCSGYSFSYAVYVPALKNGKGLDGVDFSTYFSIKAATPDGDRYPHWARYASQRISEEIQAMPYGNDRTEAVKQWYKTRREFCYDVIREAYPEAALGGESLGDINLFWD